MTEFEIFDLVLWAKHKLRTNGFFAGVFTITQVKPTHLEVVTKAIKN